MRFGGACGAAVSLSLVGGGGGRGGCRWVCCCCACCGCGEGFLAVAGSGFNVGGDGAPGNPGRELSRIFRSSSGSRWGFFDVAMRSLSEMMLVFGRLVIFCVSLGISR